MLITVSDIPITGKYYDFDFAPDAIEEIKDIQFLEPVHFTGSIYKSNQDVRIKGTVRTKIQVACNRCLELFAFPITSDFEVFYQPRPHNQKQEEDIPFGELGVLHYDDNTIDLAESTRDTIILEIPMKLLCKEDCRGLCPQCGQNLNLGPCTCTTKKFRQSPFAEFFQKKASQSH